MALLSPGNLGGNLISNSSYLLDQYPGGIGFSLRRVSRTQSNEPIIRLWKQGGQTLDVFLSGDYVDAQSILSFWDGSTPVFVDRLYVPNDGRFFAQTNTSRLAEIVAANGSLHTYMGKPALFWPASSNGCYVLSGLGNIHLGEISLYGAANPVSLSGLWNSIIGVNNANAFGGNDGNPILQRIEGTDFFGVHYTDIAGTNISAPFFSGSPFVASYNRAAFSSNVQVSVNIRQAGATQSAVAPQTWNQAPTQIGFLSIGRQRQDIVSSWRGHIMESWFYPQNHATEISLAIRNNLQNFYL